MMELSFDQEQETYFSGQVITGSLVFNLSQPISGQLTIRFQGQSKTSFNKNADKHHSLPYNGHEHHLDEVVHSSNKTFGSGKQEFPIMFCLPDNLLSSYEGPHGFVRYWCKATMVHSEKKSMTCSRLFTIISHVDLNVIKNSNLSINATDKRSSKTCCIVRQGLQQFECSLSKSGFVPGEIVSVYCTIENQRSKPILSVEVILKQTVKYSGKSTKSSEADFKEMAFAASSLTDQCPIEPFGSKKCTIKLKIPSLPPSTLKSSLIEVSYIIEVKAGKRLKAKLPITVGTIPVGQNKFELHNFMSKRESYQKIDALFANNTMAPTFKECVLSNCQSKIQNEDASCCMNEMTFIPCCLCFEYS